MTRSVTCFPLRLRILHWLMAVMILSMLFIGLFMAASAGPNYHWLVALHRPLGIAIFVLVILRLAIRLTSPIPSLPRDLPVVLQFAAHASHYLLYGLMFAMPLIGWGMLSAGGYPIPLFGEHVLLPPILPHDPALWATLRGLHTVLALLLFAIVVGHIAAAMYHALIRRDDVLTSVTGHGPYVDD